MPGMPDETAIAHSRPPSESVLHRGRTPGTSIGVDELHSCVLLHSWNQAGHARACRQRLVDQQARRSARVQRRPPWSTTTQARRSQREVVLLLASTMAMSRLRRHPPLDRRPASPATISGARPSNGVVRFPPALAARFIFLGVHQYLLPLAPFPLSLCVLRHCLPMRLASTVGFSHVTPSSSGPLFPW